VEIDVNRQVAEAWRVKWEQQEEDEALLYGSDTSQPFADSLPARPPASADTIEKVLLGLQQRFQENKAIKRQQEGYRPDWPPDERNNTAPVQLPDRPVAPNPYYQHFWKNKDGPYTGSAWYEQVTDEGK
jgi:hypothetical protein